MRDSDRLARKALRHPFSLKSRKTSEGISVFISGVTGFNSESDLPPDLGLSITPEERADNRICILP